MPARATLKHLHHIMLANDKV